MKKNIRSLLCLLLALVLTLQLAGGLALADPEISGKETLVFELYRRDPNDADKIIPVSAEQEAELLAGKSYAIELVRDNAEKSTLPLSRAAGSITLNDLLKNDLRIAPPEGFFVEQVYLRGDALESNKPKKLPFGADRESATLTLKAGALAVKDPAAGEDRFDKEALSTLSTMDPPIYAVVVVLAPLDAEKPVTVTEALDKDASVTETQVARGSERTAPAAPADSADAKFAGWQLSYGNGASLTLQPGDSFKPYADCRLEAQWTQIITITANVPVESGEGFAPNGYSLSGKLAEGDSVANVDLTVTSEDGRFYSVPSNARIERDGKDVTDQYALVYVTSEPAVKEEEPTPSEPPVTPAPEKVKITITANEPVTKDGGKTYEHNGAVLSGTLNEGDQITGLVIDVVKNEDGSYTAVPKDAVIKNGDADVTANYEITYAASQPVTPPAPAEKVKITITANEPVTKDGGKTYEQNGAVLSSGALNDGDAFGGIVIDVVKNEDGSYTAVPKDAVIKNGDTDVTANYEITYVASKPVTPPAEKIAITIRSKDRTAEYSGKLITAEEYEIVSGALAEGDTIEVKYEGGSTNVTTSPVASPISSLVIKDSAGNDVTESKYSVTIDNENAGKVTVTKHSITVTAITGTVETDGTKIIYAKDCKTGNNVFNKGHKVEGLLPGHELRGDFVKGSGKETFTTSIDLNELRVVDTANAELDVTANYDIKTVDGKLTIKVKSQTGVPVAVTTKNQSWSYDGTAHKPDQSQYNISGLLDGDVATVSLQIKQGDSQVESVTNAGTYTIVPVVTIKTKDGAAVAEGKYTVTAINGTLTVKKLDITLEAPSLPSGLKYQVKLNIYDAKGNLIKNGAKEVGTYTKKISEVHILDANGKDVSENFNITTVDGKLTIRPSSMSNSTNPKTGDDNPDGNLLYIILGVASALLLATIVTFLILQNKKKAAREAQMKDPEEYYEPDEAGEEWQQPEEAAADWDPQIPEDGWKKP